MKQPQLSPKHQLNRKASPIQPTCVVLLDKYSILPTRCIWVPHRSISPAPFDTSDCFGSYGIGANVRLQVLRKCFALKTWIFQQLEKVTALCVPCAIHHVNVHPVYWMQLVKPSHKESQNSCLHKGPCGLYTKPSADSTFSTWALETCAARFCSVLAYLHGCLGWKKHFAHIPLLMWKQKGSWVASCDLQSPQSDVST